MQDHIIYVCMICEQLHRTLIMPCLLLCSRTVQNYLSIHVTNMVYFAKTENEHEE
jgi:hypothetical protein